MYCREPSAWICDSVHCFWQRGKFVTQHCDLRHTVFGRDHQMVPPCWKNQLGGGQKLQCSFQCKNPWVPPIEAEWKNQKNTEHTSLNQNAERNGKIRTYILKYWTRTWRSLLNSCKSSSPKLKLTLLAPPLWKRTAWLVVLRGTGKNLRALKWPLSSGAGRRDQMAAEWAVDSGGKLGVRAAPKGPTYGRTRTLTGTEGTAFRRTSVNIYQTLRRHIPARWEAQISTTLLNSVVNLLLIC
jgi:hypothetical protein